MDWLCSVCSIWKLLFSKPTGLLCQGPCTAQCNFPSSNTDMYLWKRYGKLGSAQTLAAHEDALLLCSTVPVQISDTWAKKLLPKACATLGSYQILANTILRLPWTVEAEKYILLFLHPRNQKSLASFSPFGWQCSHACLCWLGYCWALLSENGAVHWVESGKTAIKIHVIFPGLTVKLNKIVTGKTKSRKCSDL